jgi:hypothetical protein
MRVKFYYSSSDQPGAQYPCDIQAVLEKIQRLKAVGVDAEAIDVAGIDDVFRPYHAALTGPPAAVRAVFGMRGALEADFGRRTPALVVYSDPTNRYPTDAYPRQDPGRGGLVGVERALDDLLVEQERVPVAQAVAESAEEEEEESH